MKANEEQVGGKHYKVGGEEHWDRVARLSQDYFQGQITKYVERWKLKNGVEDLKKARHFLDKYIELAEAGLVAAGRVQPWFNPPDEDAKLYGPRSGGDPPMTVDLGMTEAESITFDPGGHFAAAVAERGPDAFKAAVAAVKQTGYTGFTYEGGTAEWDLFTCRKCRREVRVSVNENPSNHHSCEPSNA